MSDIFNLNHTEATLCFPIRGNKVLLAEKQTKLGAGLLNGFGGKVEPVILTFTQLIFEKSGKRSALVLRLSNLLA